MKQSTTAQLIRKNRENLIVILLMAVFSFAFLLQSPLHPWVRGDARTDSSVFKTISLMMERGYMPYKDTFDHKGPVIYIINWIGDRISRYSGVWTIEYVFMTGTFFFIYKISRLKCSAGSSLITAMASISLLFVYFEGGNLVEEYAMLFIAASLYIFLDYLLNQKVTAIRLLLCGASLGATLLLRPNMISLWAVFCPFILGQTVFNRRWDDLKRFALWFTGGLCAVMVPIIIWLTVNSSLRDCWEAYIVFNKLYSSASISARCHSFYVFFETTIFVTAFGITTYMCKVRERAINIAYLIYMFVTLMFLCVGGKTHGHYGMILIPLFAYPLSSLFGEAEKIQTLQTAHLLKMIISVYFLSNVIISDWGTVVSSLPSFYKDRMVEHKSQLVTSIAEIVWSRTSEEDLISVYGNWDLIYVVSKRTHATKYSYQFPIGEVQPRIMEEYMRELQEELPEIIIIQAGRYDERIRRFLYENCYELIWSQKEDDMDGALIWGTQR